MLIEMTQHPVGQGGFFCGAIYHDRKTFRWIYDCGSNNKKELSRQIKKLPKKKIDALFLSHMHRDHVNGFDELIKRVEIDRVILPYLDEYDKLSILADYESRDALTDDVIQMVSNPGEWFVEKGARRVTLVLNEKNEDDDLGTGDIIEPERSEEDLLLDWRPPLRELTSTDSGNEISIASSKSISAIVIPKINIRWMLLTHVELADNNKKSNFMTEIQKVKNKYRATSPLDILKQKGGISDIRNCYDKIWKGHNLISMCLYIGPEKYEYGNKKMKVIGNVNFGNKFCIRCNKKISTGQRIYCFECFSYPYTLVRSSSCGGWMLTGDQDFSVARRRINFEKKYRKYLKYVNVLMVPHHGSKHNISPNFLKPYKNLDVCYVAAGSGNNYGHPHFETELVVRLNVNPLVSFHVVGRAPVSMLRMWCLVSII